MISSNKLIKSIKIYLYILMLFIYIPFTKFLLSNYFFNNKNIVLNIYYLESFKIIRDVGIGFIFFIIVNEIFNFSIKKNLKKHKFIFIISIMLAISFSKVIVLVFKLPMHMCLTWNEEKFFSILTGIIIGFYLKNKINIKQR